MVHGWVTASSNGSASVVACNIVSRRCGADCQEWSKRPLAVNKAWWMNRGGWCGRKRQLNWKGSWTWRQEKSGAQSLYCRRRLFRSFLCRESAVGRAADCLMGSKAFFNNQQLTSMTSHAHACFARWSVTVWQLKLKVTKLEWMGYRVLKKTWQCSAVLIQYQRVTDGQTDGLLPLKCFSGSLCQMISALHWQHNFASTTSPHW